ncbi:MAG: tetratricopeptide repeat protein [Spirochaetes bacterium]|nr:tetratricopeptide repeat protein [Spirochaetota bacterium]
MRKNLCRSWILFLLLAAASAEAQGPQTLDSALQLYSRGRQYQASGPENEAQKAFSSSLAIVEALLAADSGRKDIVYLKCWNLFRLGRHKEVVIAAEKALARFKDFRVDETLAESLWFLKRDEEALRYFASYVEMAPQSDERYSSAYYYIGECYMRLKKYEHADIAFSTALSIEKSMYYWWYRLGAVKELLAQYKRAYEFYGMALKLKPGFAAAVDGRARVKAKAGL